MPHDAEIEPILLELRTLSSKQIESKISKLIGTGQTLELAEELELLECERLGILDTINSESA